MFMRSYRIYILMCALVASMAVTSCHTSKSSGRSDSVHSVNKEKPQKHKPSRPAARNVAEALVNEAKDWLGTPYMWGGNDSDGVDCSGFLVAVYRNAAGINLPRTTKKQREHCLDVDNGDRAVGDILFFSSKRSHGQVAHVGMYIGDNKMIHSSSSRGVVVDDLSIKYYKEHFLGVGRPPLLADAHPVARKNKPKDTPAASGERQLASAEPKPTPKPASALSPAPTPAPVTVAAPAPVEISNPTAAVPTVEVAAVTNAEIISDENLPAPVVVTSANETKTVEKPAEIEVKAQELSASLAETEPQQASKSEPEKLSPASIVKNAFANKKK